MARLENWALTCDQDAYQAPESVKFGLTGMVYDHPGFPDGDKVVTSPLEDFSIPTLTAKTSNTAYLLGRPNSEWLNYLREIHSPSYEALKDL